MSGGTIYRKKAPLSDVRFATGKGEPFVTYPSRHGSALRDAAVHACFSAGFTPRVVLACRTGLRAYNAGRVLQSRWPGRIALLALTDDDLKGRP